MVDRLQNIPLHQLEADPDQPRKELEAVPTETEFRTLRGLADSLLQVGMLQPIRVRLVARGRYRIISGHRRFAAASLAGLEEVPCVVTDNIGDEQRLRIVQITENVQRKAMTPGELSAAVHELLHLGLKKNEIAKWLGIGADKISMLAKLTEASDEIRRALDSGTIESPRAAYDLSRMPVELQRHIIDQAQTTGKPLTQQQVQQARMSWAVQLDEPRHRFQAPRLTKPEFKAVMTLLDDGIDDNYDALPDRDRFFGDGWRKFVGAEEMVTQPDEPAGKTVAPAIALPMLELDEAYALIKQLGMRLPPELASPARVKPDALARWLSSALPARLAALTNKAR